MKKNEQISLKLIPSLKLEIIYRPKIMYIYNLQFIINPPYFCLLIKLQNSKNHGVFFFNEFLDTISSLFFFFHTHTQTNNKLVIN